MSRTGPGLEAEPWFMPRRFVLFLTVLAGTFAALLAGLWQSDLNWQLALAGGFDLAALVFIASLANLRGDHDTATMLRHARENDANRFGVLLVTGLTLLAVAVAIYFLLPAAKARTGPLHHWALAGVLISLVIAWLFSNLVYMLHYAHMYYLTEPAGGIRFPRHDASTGEYCPTYWDFGYFAMTIGMAFATADVEIVRSDFRRTATLHSFAAFFYNLIVLAFTVNVTAGS